MQTELSVQEILDCAGNYHTWGCEGGMICGVYEYIKYRGGISLEVDYPYKGFVGECRASQYNKFNFTIKSIFEDHHNDEENLLHTVAISGSIVITININNESFMRYSSGVYYEDNCSHVTNHAVLLVGFGSENGEDFWVIQNSFGVRWGEEGFIRVARNRENHCGVASESIFPVTILS